MSETAQALEHVVYCMEQAMDVRAKHWAAFAAESIRRDLDWPDHLHTYKDQGVGVRCDRCDTSGVFTTVASAADFRDRHIHCGEPPFNAWVCPSCDGEEFGLLERCRWCDTVRPEGGPLRQTTTDLLLATRALYTLLADDEPVATILCGSLLRARRAVRAMYPGQPTKAAFAGWPGEERR